MLCEHEGMHGRASDGASNTNGDGRAKGVCIACVLCSLLIALPSIVVSSMCNGLACSAHTREDIKKIRYTTTWFYLPPKDTPHPWPLTLRAARPPR